VARLRAGVGRFRILAVVETPIAGELVARRRLRKRARYITVANVAMLGDVADRHRIGDSLKAEYLDQPVEQCGGVVVSNGLDNAAVTQAFTQILHVGG
jgi:hypothetical protein